MNRKRTLEYCGKVHTLDEWAEITGLSKGAIKGRLRKGWPVQEILGTPPIPRGHGRHYTTPVANGCKGCFYWRLLHYSAGSVYHIRYCAYIILTGHRRPCPAAHCTEYKPARKGQKGRA